MSDSIHKKQLKKDYPHFDHFYLGGNSAYAEGYDRIFGKKEGKNDKKVQVLRQSGEKEIQEKRKKRRLSSDLRKKRVSGNKK